MAVLVVGSVAYDSVKTPAGSRDAALGGSATYFSIAGSYFADASVVAVVGDDFKVEHVQLLESHRVNTSGLERRSGKTFHWSGVYGAEGVNTRDTLETHLNVFADFSPKLSAQHRRHPYVFLANIDPDLQMEVLSQMEPRPRLVGLDTMNFWIEGKRDSLQRVVESTDVLFMDEGEARSFAGEANLVRAARRIHEMGPDTLIVKRGEHGVLLFRNGAAFAAPAFPLESVVDATGAGDCFAGGFMGYLAATGDLSDAGYRRAAVLGSVMGSFAVESFSADRVSCLSREEIEERLKLFTQLSQFEPFPDGVPWRDKA